MADARNQPSMTWDQARAVLGVSPEAADADLRAAYLERVRQHPPDRDPDGFERVRDAYEQLRDPRLRARQVLAGPDPTAPLPSLLDGLPAPRKFVGPRPWVDALREAMKEKRP